MSTQSEMNQSLKRAGYTDKQISDIVSDGQKSSVLVAITDVQPKCS